MISMTNKDRYRILCTEEPSIPLFLQYWWMETVCMEKEWDVILVTHEGIITGAMPYLIGKKMGMRYVLQPELTQYNGVWFRYPNWRDENEKLSFEKKILVEIIKQLKSLRLAYYEQNFSPQFTNWLPFYWSGFRQTTRYTYRIPDISDLASVFSRFDRDTRQKKILKLSQKLQVTFEISPEDFYAYHKQYWDFRGQKDLYSEKFVTRVCSCAIIRNQGVIIGLKDENNVMYCCRFIVYDSHCAHTLLSAYNPQFYVNGVTALLFWESIKYVSKKTKMFDFEGSMDEGIEHSYRQYGTIQTPYFQISKSNNSLFSVLKWLKQKM